MTMAVDAQPSSDTASLAAPPCGGDPPVCRPFFERTDWLSFGLCVAACLVVYLWKRAPEVTLGDSGFLSTAAAYAGVPSPPGHPAWTIYSWLFATLIPCGNIAWRVTVGSGVAASLANGLIALWRSWYGGGALARSGRPPPSP